MTETTKFMKNPRVIAYLQVIVLALSASVIYSAPYLRQLFKTSLLEAFSLTEIQLANLSSTYAIACIICYIPGGWLADKVAPRKLVIISLFASAGTYVWYASIPGYSSLLIIYGLWGVIGVGLLWSAMLKQVRLLAGAEEQGRLYGTLEGTRGLFEAILLTVATFVFGLFLSRKTGMINVIWLYVGFSALLGFVLMFVKGPGDKDEQGPSSALKFTDFLLIVKEPSVWLMCIIVSAVYHLFWASIEFPSFAETGGFGMPLAAATALGTAKIWMRPFGGILGGMIGDKITNVKLMMYLFLGGVATCMFLALMSTTAENTWMLWVFIFPFGMLIYAARGVMWAMLYDCPIPKSMTGTAIGFISIVGYSPDAYVPQVNSYLLSNYSTSTGYQLFFAYVAFASLIGFIASWFLSRLPRAGDAD
jgi:sugar phosphate permease